MSLFSAAFLETLRQSHDLDRWPGVLADDRRPGVRERIEGALGILPDPVRDAVQARLTSPAIRDLHLGRALIWGISLAGIGGSVPSEITDAGHVLMTDASDARWVLAPLVFHTGSHHAGRPEDLKRLVRALDNVFGVRPFAMHVRRPVAPGFDPEPVARAVQLWLMAVDRGEWQGRHAVYDEKDVCLELTLLDMKPREDVSSLIFFQGPSSTLQRLAVVDAHLQTLARSHADDPAWNDLPLVGLLVASPRWELARGYQSQLLYGTADEAHADHEDGTGVYRALYRDKRYSLYADTMFEGLASLWWAESRDVHPLAVHAWSHDNPWSVHRDRVPAFPGPRFCRTGEPAADGVVMTWDFTHPGHWDGAA